MRRVSMSATTKLPRTSAATPTGLMNCINIRQPGTSGYSRKMQSIPGQSSPLKGIGNGFSDSAWSKLLYQGQANELSTQ
jgi:hypothetical protein